MSSAESVRASDAGDEPNTSRSRLRHKRCLLVGVRGHGGEEVYSRLLRDYVPEGFRCSATFDFHSSCEFARRRGLHEILLNRLVHPLVPFNIGFRVLEVAQKVDLVHIHTHPTVLRHLGRRPIVFSAGSSHYHWLRDYEKWPEDKIARAYGRARIVYRRLGILDALLNHERITLSYTFSEHARQIYLAQGVPEWKIRVIYPGFDIPEQSRSNGGELTYLFMGRDSRRKGGDMVLSAFQRLRMTRPEVRLIYVSDESRRVSIPGVEALPLVPPSEVPNIYRRAHVFVNPTRAEGFGFTNVEALGFGLPVISTRLGAIPEVVEDGRTGVLIPPDDQPALFEAMDRLAREGGLRSEMSIAARKRFEAYFSIGTFRAAIAAIYEEAMERARDGRGGTTARGRLMTAFVPPHSDRSVEKAAEDGSRLSGSPPQ